jgi:sugar lactone lactonase YvrE
VRFGGEFELLESRLERSTVAMEFVTNEVYSELFDNLSGMGEDYELEMVLGRRGNQLGEFLLPTHVGYSKNQLYIVDFGNQRIQSFDLQGQPQGVVVFPGLLEPVYIGFIGEQIFVVDRGAATVRIYVPEASGMRQVKTIGKKGVEQGELNVPGSVQVDSRGLIWVSDEQNSRLEVFTHDIIFSRNKNYFMNIDEYQPNVYLRAPKALFWVEDLKRMFVIDSGTAQILSFDQDGNYFGLVDVKLKKGQAFMPQSVYVDDYGNLYIADNISHSILKFDSKGSSMGAIGFESQFPQNLATDASLLDRPKSMAFSLVTTKDFFASDSRLSFPQGLYVDQVGDLLICDWGHNQVKKFSKSYFRKAMTYYRKRKFRLAIDNFLKCDRRNEKYHLVEFYLAMCHYNLGGMEVSYMGKVDWYRKVRDYLESLKLKSEIGKYDNRQIRNTALYYLSRVNSYQLDK